jgi:hypothetical protein
MSSLAYPASEIIDAVNIDIDTNGAAGGSLQHTSLDLTSYLSNLSFVSLSPRSLCPEH